MIVQGGCLCGAIRIKSTGHAIHKALCHCLDCRKITGSTYSTNLVVPNTTFTITKGQPKQYLHKSTGSGNTITLFFCGDCGSTLWSRSSTYGETTVLKAGVLDNEDVWNESCGEEGQGQGKGEGEGGKEEEQGGEESGRGDGQERLAWEDKTRPLLELYVKRRPLWVASVEGAVQDEDGAAQKEA